MKFNVEVKVPTEVDLIPGDRVAIQTCHGNVMCRVYKISMTYDHPEGYVVVDTGSYYPLTTYGKTWWKV